MSSSDRVRRIYLYIVATIILAASIVLLFLLSLSHSGEDLTLPKIPRLVAYPGLTVQIPNVGGVSIVEIGGERCPLIRYKDASHLLVDAPLLASGSYDIVAKDKNGVILYRMPNAYVVGPRN